jgi:hypothetical protein
VSKIPCFLLKFVLKAYKPLLCIYEHLLLEGTEK